MMSVQRRYPYGTYSSDSDSEGVNIQYQSIPIYNPFRQLFQTCIYYLTWSLIPITLLATTFFCVTSAFYFVTSAISTKGTCDCHCTPTQYNHAPQKNIPRYGDSKKGRTVDSLFCPNCGTRYRPSLRICPSSTCGKPLTIHPKCGNCHIPREDNRHRYCRQCGLLYSEVGVIEPVVEQSIG